MDAETGSVTQNRRIIKVQLVGSFATGKSSFFNQVQAIFPPVEPYSSFNTPTDMMFLPEIRVGGQEWQVTVELFKFCFITYYILRSFCSIFSLLFCIYNLTFRLDYPTLTGRSASTRPPPPASGTRPLF